MIVLATVARECNPPHLSRCGPVSKKAKRTGFVRSSYGAACADSVSRITMSPRQVFGPSFVQVTPPSVQVEFKVPQALSQFGRGLLSVQVDRKSTRLNSSHAN